MGLAFENELYRPSEQGAQRELDVLEIVPGLVVERFATLISSGRR